MLEMHANLEIWDVELVVGGEVVGTCGGCHHFVPCLLAGLLTRGRDQPKLCHGHSSGAAERKLRGEVYLDLCMLCYYSSQQLIKHWETLSRSSLSIALIWRQQRYNSWVYNTWLHSYSYTLAPESCWCCCNEMSWHCLPPGELTEMMLH